MEQEGLLWTTELHNWQMGLIPDALDTYDTMLHGNDVAPTPKLTLNAEGRLPRGAYRARFVVKRPADTFLDMSACGKGVVFLNGFCLGRFWDIGPQKRLYIPAPLLRAGRNELLIVETEGRFGGVELADAPELG